MVLMPYLSYMLAELLSLSGILTVFFCGIVMSHYTWHNITESSRTTTRHAFATLSFIAETFIFLYVGMDAVDSEKWKSTNVHPLTSISLSAALLMSVILGRAAFVFPLSSLSNFLRRTSGAKISFRHQVIIWWAGLMRGAVSIALAYNQFTSSGPSASPYHGTVITSTIIVVLVSTVVCGMLTKPLVDWLIPDHIRSSSSGSSTPSSPKYLSDDDGGLTRSLLGPCSSSDGNIFSSRTSSLQMLLRAPTWTVHYFWRKFDDTYMRPMFGGRCVQDSIRQEESRNSPIDDFP